MKKIHKFMTYIDSVKFCFVFSWKSSPFFTLSRLILGVITPFCTIASSACMRVMIDNLVNKSEIYDLKQVFLPFLGWVLVLFVSTFSQRLLFFVQDIHNRHLERNLKSTVLAKSLKADLHIYDSAEYYDRLDIATRNPAILQQTITSSISTVSVIISTISTFIILFSFDAFGSILLVAVSVPLSFFNLKYTKQLFEIDVKQTSSNRKANYIFDVSTSPRFAFSVRSHNMENGLTMEYDDLSKQIISQRASAAKKRTITMLIFEGPALILIAALGGSLLYKTLRGLCSVGDFSFYIAIWIQFWNSISSATAATVQLVDDKLRIDQFRDFLKGDYNSIKSGKQKLLKVESVEFSHVYFRYPNSEKWALRDVSFLIESNSCVALVGQNGSGKSTIIKLLLRLYLPTKGNIYINGLPQDQYDLTDLRNKFSTYQQNEPNYSFSVGKNVSLYNREKHDKIMTCLNLAQAKDLLNKMPCGLETCLGKSFSNDAVDLSGGENQRIALARAFYQLGDVLVLDEPFSALDAEAEQNIMGNLTELKQSKICLFSSHHLFTTKIADKIIVIENGQIIEEGTKEDLLTHNGYFTNLLKMQNVSVESILAK